MTAAPSALLYAASQPYRLAGRFAYYFARAKLNADPGFRALLERGMLQSQQRVLDLGCGQGLLASWLAAAERCWRYGLWPAHWPPAPRQVIVHGIELMPRDVARAHSALGRDAGSHIVQGDICLAAFKPVDVVVIFDVLHYLPQQAQRSVLLRARQALPFDGRLLLRVGDTAGGWRFRYGKWVDKTVMLARGGGFAPLHYRSLAQWQALLRECGFDCQAILPMSEGTRFSNVLLSARAR